MKVAHLNATRIEGRIETTCLWDIQKTPEQRVYASCNYYGPEPFLVGKDNYLNRI